MTTVDDWSWAAYIHRIAAGRGMASVRLVQQLVDQDDRSAVTEQDRRAGAACREYWALKLDEILAETADRYTQHAWAVAVGREKFVIKFAVSMLESYAKKVTVNLVY